MDMTEQETRQVINKEQRVSTQKKRENNLLFQVKGITYLYYFVVNRNKEECVKSRHRKYNIDKIWSKHGKWRRLVKMYVRLLSRFIRAGCVQGGKDQHMGGTISKGRGTFCKGRETF